MMEWYLPRLFFMLIHATGLSQTLLNEQSTRPEPSFLASFRTPTWKSSKASSAIPSSWSLSYSTVSFDSNKHNLEFYLNPYEKSCSTPLMSATTAWVSIRTVGIALDSTGAILKESFRGIAVRLG